jgi:hypothetical protein
VGLIGHSIPLITILVYRYAIRKAPISKRNAKIVAILYNAVVAIYWFITLYNSSNSLGIKIVGIPGWAFASIGILAIYIPEGYVCYRILKASGPKERKNIADDKNK